MISKQLRVWLGLGLQSFGGGVATLALIRRAAVEQEKWVTDLEFTQYWSLCQLAPGINLLALTILLGRRAGGVAGVLAGLAGLLLPSVSITIAMTAAYASVRHAAWMQAALHGLLPATIGLGLVAAIQMLWPLAADARKDGVDSLIVSAVALVGSATVVAVWRVHVIVALLGAGAVCALHAWLRSRLVPRPAAE